MLKKIFLLNLTKCELGALISIYGKKDNTVVFKAFLREIIKLGMEERNKIISNNISNNINSKLNGFEIHNERNKNDSGNNNDFDNHNFNNTKNDINNKSNSNKDKNDKIDFNQLIIDFKFSLVDESTAEEKIKIALQNYRKNLLNIQSFQCSSLSYSQFKSQLQNIFSLYFTSLEFGYIITKFDIHKKGKIICKTFLNELLEISYRYDKNNEINKKNEKINNHEKYEKNKNEIDININQKNGKENEKKVNKIISLQYTENDKDNVLKKLKNLALNYNTNTNLNTYFNTTILTPLSFHNAILKTFDIIFTPQEYGALFKYFDEYDNDEINCKFFINHFLSLSLLEKSRQKKLNSLNYNDKKIDDNYNSNNNNNNYSNDKNNSDIENDTNVSYSDIDKQNALSKMKECAIKVRIGPEQRHIYAYMYIHIDKIYIYTCRRISRCHCLFTLFYSI